MKLMSNTSPSAAPLKVITKEPYSPQLVGFIGVRFSMTKDTGVWENKGSEMLNKINKTRVEDFFIGYELKFN
jgi:hypothetical protein